MPPKKKKTQIKKVERGFATTSIPKKIVAQPEPEPEPEPEPAPSITESVEAAALGDAQDQLDEHELKLQEFIDKHQEKVEKEITRAIKAIETDQRLSTSWPSIELGEQLQRDVMRLLEESEPDQWTQTTAKDSESFLEQLGIFYGTLLRLGFDESTVADSVMASSKMDFDEFVDQLCIRCSPEGLDVATLRQRPSIEPVIPGIPLLSPAMQAVTLKSPPPTVSAKTRTQKRTHDQKLASEDEAAIAAAKLTLQDIDEDPNLAYVQLKMKLLELTHPIATRTRIPLETPMMLALRSQIEVVKRDYLFREKLAEAEFQAKRKEWLSSTALANLRCKQSEQTSSISETLVTGRAEKSPDSRNVLASTDSDGDSEEGGMLQLLDIMPPEISSATVSTITVRDLPTPKTWTNRTPKNLLQEISTSIDRSASVSYRSISGTSRAKRAAVTVRWRNGYQSEWEMKDYACRDMLQAEFFIATEAAHALTFATRTGGFQAVNGNTKITAYKSLPPAFRDLWEDEIEPIRLSEQNKANRQIWAKLSELQRTRCLDETATKRANRKIDGTLVSPLPSSRVSTLDPSAIQSEYYNMRDSVSYQKMLEQRNSLPIAAFRQSIVETIDASRVVVLSGETGCGKSTQLPSFILEDQLSRGKHCKILVTEPRRISAISLAQRVSQELGEAPGTVGSSSSFVGYSIRLESHTSKRTRLTFVTNGIALRMLEGGSGRDGQGTALDEVTHVIIDEVHERNIDSDFLLIVLKSLLDHRRDLKVVLMSATLDADKISNFFGGCPIITVPGRTFPVEVQFLEDAIEYTKYSITPTSPYARQDRNRSRKQITSDWNEDIRQDDDDSQIDDDFEDKTLTNVSRRYSQRTKQTFALLDEYDIPYELIIRLLEVVCFEDSSHTELSQAFLIFMPGLAEIRRMNDILAAHPRFGTEEFVVYPLHSTISSDGQGVVFGIPPPGVRKIVIATNIAETGVTIPDITCVIDTGKHKEMRFDEKRQISRLIQTFVAKSNAVQRRGRAGRVRSGLCFHLFSGARHAKMVEHPLPEMLRLSLSDLALRIKIMKINLGSSIKDVLSRALDPPSAVNIQRAVAALVEVRALTTTEEITPMGRLLSKLPTDVHLGKFLLIAALFKCLDPALTIAATLNSKSPFVTPFGQEQEAGAAKARFASDNSDFLTIHNAFASFRRASANPGFIRKFCKENYLSLQNLQQIEDLRQQFLGYLIDASFIQVDQAFSREFSRIRYSRQRNTQFVAIPAEYDTNSRTEDDNMALFNAALVAGLYPKLLVVDPTSSGRSMKTFTNNQAAFFHPSSVNFGKRPTDMGTGYLMYSTIMQSKKLYAWETGPVDDIALILLCGEAEFKILSNTIDIDRKIKYQVGPETGIALKHLRRHLLENIALQLRGKVLSESQAAWNVLAMKALALGNLKASEK